MDGNVKELTDGTFAAAIGSGVSLVDFWADWCPPCRMQGPIVERLAKELDGKAMVAKIDVDANGETASRYGVSSIPTLIVFRDGREMKRFVGLQQEAVLADAVKANLKSST